MDRREPDGDLDVVLEHYGIKGMKWGVRRSEKQLARARAQTPESKKTEATRQRAKKLGIGSVSNADMKEAITRMNLEDNFNRLSSERKSKGRKFVDNLIQDVTGIGRTQARNAANQEIARLVSDAIKNRG